MMLCRVADSLFWMSRYFERAENTARLVSTFLQLLLESRGLSGKGEASYWGPLLDALGDRPLFEQQHDAASSDAVTEFLTLSDKNPSSIFNCVKAARENARMIRDQISPEMWSCINRLYLALQEQSHTRSWRREPFDFYDSIVEASHLFQGITEATFAHRSGYEFIKAGRYLERADKTIRFLDTHHYAGISCDHGGVAELAHWIAVLRSTSALEAFQQVYVTDLSARAVTRFLLQSRDFPRAVLFSLNHLQLSLHAISGCPVSHYSNEAERLTGRLISQLLYTDTEELFDEGLHTFLSHAEGQIDRVALEIGQTFMYFPIVDPASEPEVEAEAEAQPASSNGSEPSTTQRQGAPGLTQSQSLS